jgi:hypothetical protein
LELEFWELSFPSPVWILLSHWNDIKLEGTVKEIIKRISFAAWQSRPEKKNTVVQVPSWLGMQLRSANVLFASLFMYLSKEKLMYVYSINCVRGDRSLSICLLLNYMFTNTIHLFVSLFKTWVLPFFHIYMYADCDKYKFS